MKVKFSNKISTQFIVYAILIFLPLENLSSQFINEIQIGTSIDLTSTSPKSDSYSQNLGQFLFLKKEIIRKYNINFGAGIYHTISQHNNFILDAHRFNFNNVQLLYEQKGTLYLNRWFYKLSFQSGYLFKVTNTKINFAITGFGKIDDLEYYPHIHYQYLDVFGNELDEPKVRDCSNCKTFIEDGIFAYEFNVEQIIKNRISIGINYTKNFKKTTFSNHNFKLIDFYLGYKINRVK